MPIDRTHCYALVLGVFTLLATGCNTAANTDLNYKTAINDHFKAFPTCIWSEPKKFPVQAATSDDSKTEGYDALTRKTEVEARSTTRIAGAPSKPLETVAAIGRLVAWVLDSV